MWLQRPISLTAKPRGFHLITDEVLGKIPELKQFRIGTAHFLLQHTSASLSLNENADVSVRSDLESHFNVLAPENADYYVHIYEGSDDMPAHIKSALLGVQLTLPIQEGQLSLGIWQGLVLGEHRNNSGPRRLLVTLNGEGYQEPTA